VYLCSTGLFDCSNIIAGSVGNACDGDNPFPILETSQAVPGPTASVTDAPVMSPTLAVTPTTPSAEAPVVTTAAPIASPGTMAPVVSTVAPLTDESATGEAFGKRRVWVLASGLTAGLLVGGLLP
jgi:hypothetical protein